MGLELEVGHSCLRVEQIKGDMKIYHGSSDKLLFRRKMYSCEWDKLWEFLTTDPYGNCDGLPLEEEK